MLMTMTTIAIFKEHDPTHEPIYITVHPCTCTKKAVNASVPDLVLWPPYQDQERQLPLMVYSSQQRHRLSCQL